MIDLHTHLDLYPNALELLEKVNRLNKFTLAVTTSPRAWLATTAVFAPHKNIHVALGLHPEIALTKFNELELLTESIPKSLFIGEVGIDGSTQHIKSLPKQKLIFDKTLKECQKSGGRIISIHSKRASSTVLTMLKKYPSAGNAVLHWFSGPLRDLDTAINMRCWFSVNPLMAKSKKGRELLTYIPKQQILPESDGPFAVRKGSPIMPWEAIEICEDLSEIWNIPRTEVHYQLSNNLERLLKGFHNK